MTIAVLREIFLAIFFFRFLLMKLPKPRMYTFWPEAILFLMIEKKASTEAETSALSIPVFSAIWLITSALVTGKKLYVEKFQVGKVIRGLFKRKMKLLIITVMRDKTR
jgi:hypothetical protein